MYIHTYTYDYQTKFWSVNCIGHQAIAIQQRFGSSKYICKKRYVICIIYIHYSFCRILKLIDKFMNLGSSISSTESDANIHQAKVRSAIDRLSIIWKSDLSNKIKQDFFQSAVVPILLYGCTTWMLTKCIEKKLNRNCTRMLQAILKKSWKQHLHEATAVQTFPISKTI